MATAKKTTITEQKPVEVPVVQLTLTPDEAKALYKVAVNVGGNGPGRKDVDRVLVALDSVVDHYTKNSLKTEGAIYFRDKGVNTLSDYYTTGITNGFRL